MEQTIDPEEADRLLHSGGWLDEPSFMLRISKAAVAQQRAGSEFGQDPSVESLRESRGQLVEALRACFDHRVIEGEDSGGGARGFELRVGKGAIYKVPALSGPLETFLGLLFAGLTATKLFPLFLLWAGVSVPKMIKTLIGGYEKLSDPVEHAVFEAVFQLQGQVSVRDYDALKERDFAAAYGTIAPTVDEVADKLAGEHPRESVEAALAALVQRDILIVRGGRWSIRF